MTEEWKYIEDTDDKYMISNLGNVKSLKTEKLLSDKNLRSGYKSVYLVDKAHKIHRLVALAFVKNDDTAKKIAVDHKDGNKMNNCADNLEWVTIKENNHRSRKLGLNPVTKRAVCKLDSDCNIIDTFESLQDARIKTGISDAGIAKCCKNTRSSAGGFKWKFRDENPNEKPIDVSNFVETNDFPGYLISKEGIIYSKLFKKVKKQQTNNDGYKVITLTNNNKKKSLLVHRLVASHFIKNPDNKDFVNHKDSCRTNCHVDNLEWVTQSENSIHAFKQKKSRELQTPKSLSKGNDGSGENSEVKEKRLKD